MNAEGQIMAFLNECHGVKSQLAMELELVVGMWRNLSSPLIDSYKIGTGTHSDQKSIIPFGKSTKFFWEGVLNFFQKVLHSINSRILKPLLAK